MRHTSWHGIKHTWSGWLALALVAAGSAAMATDVLDVRRVDAKQVAIAAKDVVAAADFNGLPVFVYEGEYDIGQNTGRASLSRAYLGEHTDDIDFLIAFTDFDFETGEASAFANRIKNDTQGIGLDAFDSTSAFGSASGRLQTYIDMAMLSRWEWRNGEPRYAELLDVSIHEVMHRWVAHPRVMIDGQPSTELLGRDQAHWNFFLDSDASVMYGARWAQRNDGTFEAIEVRRRLSELDLYLGGFLAASEVAPLRLIRNGQGAVATDLPRLGFTTPGQVLALDIDAVIAATGARVPNVSVAQKHFNAGLILVLRPGQPMPADAPARLFRYARDLESRFQAMTRGRATLSIRNTRRNDVAGGGPAPLTGSAPCPACPFDPLRSGDWLLQRQRPDGSWHDKNATVPQATAAALRSLAIFSQADAARTSASQFLASHASRQFDDLRWKLAAQVLPGAQDAVREQTRADLDGQGIAGLDEWFAPSAWDLATAIDAALGANTIDQFGAVLLLRLAALQNPDGSFAAAPGGRGHIATTAFVASRLARVELAEAEAMRIAATAWLRPQLAANGQFSGDEHGIATAWTVAAHAEQVDAVLPSISFLRSRQGLDGDYSGSALTTAEVLRAIAAENRANLRFDSSGLSTLPAAPIAGDSVRLAVRVVNDGPGPSLPSTVAWFDGDPDAGGIAMGAASSLPRMAPGQAVILEREWPTIGLEGVHAITVDIDPLQSVDELNESDNQLARNIDLGVVAAIPDAAFDATSFAFAPTGANSFPATLRLTGTVLNLGGAAVDDLVVAVYAQRAGQRIERARLLVDIAAQSSASVQIDVVVEREDAGHVFVVADPDNTVAEIREANNELRIGLAQVSGIDLDVQPADLVLLDPPALRDQPVDVRVSLRNRGSQDSGAFVLRTHVTFSDTSFAIADVPIQLAAGAETSRVVRFPALRAGIATLTAELVINGAPGDVNAANNQASLAIEVLDASAPNLTVASTSLSTVPELLKQGAVGELRAIVGNAGTAVSVPVRIEVSIGSSLGASRVLGSVILPDGIDADAEVPVAVALTEISESGLQTLFLRIDADAVVDESSEADNVAFKQVVVQTLPDLSVTSASISLTPTVPVVGQMLRADVSVRNLGAQAAEQVEVRLLAGDLATGVQVAAPVVVARIEGNASALTSFEWEFGTPVAATQLSLVVDAPQQIREGREDNNLAVRMLETAAPSFASEPYFSPNGDGIKDTTEFSFTTLGSEVERIDVIDRGDQIVRRFDRNAFSEGGGVSVVWDGRRDDGRIARDGDYRAEAKSAEGGVLAQTMATLDTDHSSFVEAVGTQFESRRLVPATNIAVPAPHMSARAELVLQNPRDPTDPNGTRELPGLYRFDPVLGTMDVVVDEQWLLTHGGVDAVAAFAVVGEGRWLVIATRNAPGVFELWRASMQSRSAPVSLGVFSENHTPTLFDAPRNRVLVWVEGNAGANVKATLVELGSGSQVELATNGVEGSLLDIGDEWLVVGRRAMEDLTEPVPPTMQVYDYFRELHVVPLDASDARTVFGPGESGYVAVRSGTGALVHQIASGRERLEWRPFAAESARVLADREAASVCHFTWAADAYRQNVAAMDHAGRVLHVIDMGNGSARQFPAPASRRLGDYVPEHVTEVGDEESRDFEEQRLPLIRVEPWGEDACIEGMPLSFPTQRDEPRHLWISPDHVIAGASEQIIVPNGLRMGGVTDFMHVALADGEVTVLDDVSGVTPITWPLADAADIAEYGGSDIDQFAEDLDWRFATGSYYKNRLWGYPTGVLLDDGSGAAVGGRLYADARIALGADPEPIVDTDLHWARAQRFVVRDLDGGGSARSSLLNNVALLRVRSRDGGLLLSGVAMDRNLETYEVEWSRADIGPQWHPLGGVVSEPANGELMFWVPPEPGDYRLRLTLRDRAGNVATDEARAIVLQGADIDDISLTPTHVSPNGDGVKDVVEVAFNVLRATDLDFDVRDLDGNLVYRASSTHVAPGRVTATWDGHNQSGVRVADGVYTISLGRWFSRQIHVDTTLPVLSLLRGIAARGTDGVDSPASELFGLSDRVVRNVNVSVEDRHLDAWQLVLVPDSEQAQTITSGQDVAHDRPVSHDANTPGGLTLTASDLAGNVASVSMPGTRPELRTVARYVVDSPLPLSEHAWGCKGRRHACIYGHDGEFAPESLSREFIPGRFVLLDLWVQSHLQTHSPRVMQQAGDGTWQNLPLVSAEQTLQGWRLIIAPVIHPETTTFNLQAFVDTSASAQLRSELLDLVRRQSRITELNLIRPGIPDVCANNALIAAAGPLGTDQALVCARENFEGIDYAPHLVVRRNPDDAASTTGQLVLVRDGVWLFRIEGACQGLNLTAHDRFGVTYTREAACVVLPQGLLDVMPDIQSCGDALPERVTYSAGAVVPPGRQLRAFTVDVVLAEGEERNIAQNSYPSTDTACDLAPYCIRSRLSGGAISTAGFANGRHALRITSEFDNGTRSVLIAPLVVDRGGPQLLLNNPEPAARMCLSANMAGEIVAVEGEFDFSIHGAAGFANRYRLRSVSGTPDGGSTGFYHWEGLFFAPGGPYSSEGESGLFSLARLARTELVVPAPIEHQPLVLGIYPLSGSPGADSAVNNRSLIFDIEAVGWSGVPVCRSVEFIGDSTVDARLVSTHSNIATGEGALGHTINPVGAEIYRNLDVQLRFDEADLSVQAYLRREGESDELLDEFTSGVAGSSVVRDWTWDGRLPDGSPAPSGRANIVFRIVDGCGHSLDLQTRLIEIDSVPPEVTVDTPVAGAAIGSVLVPVRYRVADRSDGVVLIEALIESGLVVASHEYRRSPGQVYRDDWNRADRSGPVTFRFTATDAVGNEALVERQFELLPRPVVLIADAAAIPEVFSPNSDGRVDQVTLDYALAQASLVTLRLRDGGGALLSTLINNEPKPAGSFQHIWDGSGLPPNAADGSYTLELTATSVIDSNASESVLLEVVVDRTAPQLRRIDPAGDFSPGYGPLAVEVDELHFGSAQWQFDGESGSLDGPGSHELLSLDAASESQHALTLAAEDAVGNRATSNTQFTIDRTPPIAVIATPADAAVLGGTEIAAQVSGSATDTNFSEATLSIRVAGGVAPLETLATLTQPVDNSAIAALDLLRGDGSFELLLHVRDLAGNEVEVMHAIDIDRTPPTLVLTTPLDDAMVGATLRIEGSVQDAHLRDYRLRLATQALADLGLFTDIALATESVDNGMLFDLPLELPDGDYVVEIVATDAVGLTTAQRRRIKRDTEAPPTPLQLVATREGADDVLLVWTPVASADLAGCAVYRDGVRITPDLVVGAQWIDRDVSDGRIGYRVTAIDRAGNASPPSNRAEVVIDRQPPTVRLIAPQPDAIVAGTVDVFGTAHSEDDFERYRLELEGPLPATTRILLAESPQPVQSDRLGQWDSRAAPEGARFRALLEATDINGNRAETGVEFEVDNLPPAAPTGLTATAQGSNAEVQWNANSEPDLLGYVLLRDGNPVNSTSGFPDDLRDIALTAITWLDLNLADGEHSWQVHAIDRAGNLSAASQPAALTFSNRPPEVRITFPANATEFTESLTLIADSDDTDVVEVRFSQREVGAGSWTAIGLPLTERPWRVTWDAELLPFGDYEIRAEATDAQALDDPTPAQIEVRKVDRTPPAQVQNLQARADGADITISWDAVTDTDLVHYLVERRNCATCAQWTLVATVAAGTVSHVDSDRDDGRHEYRVRAVDTHGNEGEHSASDDAVVFTIQVETPYSPVLAASVDIALTTPRAGELSGTRTTAGGTTAIPPVPVASAGPFQLVAQALDAGSNRLDLTVLDAQGNRSRVASTDVLRGVVPSVPTGLALNAVDHDITATWNANPEPNIIGYRLWHRGQSVLAERAVDALTALDAEDIEGPFAVDGDLATGWLHHANFSSTQAAIGRSLAISLPQAQWVSGLTLTWMEGRVPLQYRIEARAGTAFVTLRRVALQASASHPLQLDVPYYTSELRVVLESVTAAGPTVALAEVAVRELPLIASTDYTLAVLDGQHPFAVSAVNDFGFESARSPEVSIDIGDAIAPDPVVLSGSAVGQQAELIWTASSAPDTARYQLLRDGQHRVYVDASVLSFIDGPRPNGSDTYVVIAEDAAGNASAASNEVTLIFAQEGPGVPVDVRVTAVPEGSALRIDWRAGAGAVPVRYALRRALAETGPWSIVAGPTLTEQRDGGLTNGTRYWYTVEAFDAADNASGESAPVSGVPEQSAAPASPELRTPVRDGSEVSVHRPRVLVTGMAQPGSTVQVRRDGQTIGSAPAIISEQLQHYVSVPVSAPLHASPSGAWFWSDADADGVQGIAEPSAGVVPAITRVVVPLQRTAVAFTRDELLVTHRADEARVSLHALPAMTVLAEIDLPFAAIDAIAISSDLRWAIVRGDAVSLGDGMWVVAADSGSTTRITTNGFANLDFASVDFAESLELAAARGTDGTVWRIDLVAGDAQSIAAASAAAPVDIDPETGSILWATQTGAAISINATDIAGTTLPLGVAVAAAWWEAAGGVVLLQPDGDIVVRDATNAIELRRIAIPLEAPTQLHASASGRLLVANAQGDLFTVDPAGHWRVPELAMDLGRNALTAVASDSSGRTSAPSAGGDVIRLETGAPDLAINASELRALPASGPTGANYAAVATVRNLGSEPSGPTTLTWTLTPPTGSAQLLTPAAALPALAPGQSLILSRNLGALNETGAYRIAVTVDPGNTVTERDELNNVATTTLLLGNSVVPVLELVLDATSFAPGVDVTGLARITNPGSPFSGAVQLQVLDSGNALVAEIGTQSVQDLPFGQSIELPVRWVAAAAAGGAYRVRATLRNVAQQQVAQQSANVDIRVQRDLQLSIQPEQPVYVIPATMRIDSALQFRSGNAPLQGAVLTTTILAPDGQVAFVETTNLPLMLAGYRLRWPTSWPIAGSSGVYGLRAEVRLAGVLLASAQSSVVVATATDPESITGAIMPAPVLPAAGRAASIGFAASTTASTPFAINTLRLRLFDATATQLLATAEVNGPLSNAGALTGALDLTPLGLPVADHIAVLDVLIEGESVRRPLATRSISMVDGLAPDVAWREPVEDGWVRRPSELAARVVDQHSPIERVEMAVDGAGFRDVSLRGDGLYGTAIGGLPDGPHVASVRAMDRAGNLSALLPRRFQVDGTPPVIEITGVAEGDVVAVPVNAVVTIIEAHPAAQVILLDGSTYTSGDPISGEGEHLLSVSASDLAGNEARASVRFRIDRTPPPVAFVQPLDGDETVDAQVDVVVASEAGATIELVVGGFADSAIADATGIARFTAVPLSIGFNTLSAVAIDAVDNSSAPASIQLRRIDNSGAVFSGSLVPSAAQIAVGTPVALDWQVLHQAASARVGVPIRIDVTHVASQVSLGSDTELLDLPAEGAANGRSEFASVGAALGAYVATLTLDDNGQPLQLAIANFDLVDGNPPWITVLHPLPDALISSALVVRAQVVDDEAIVDTVNARIDNGVTHPMPADGAMADNFVTAALDLADGAHSVVVTAADSTGNAAQSPAITFVVDRTPPEILVSGVTDGERRNTPATVVVDVVDAHLQSSTVTLDGQPFVSGNTVSTGGVHQLVVEASDTGGLQSQRTLTFTIDTTPPPIEFTFPAEGAVLAGNTVDVGGLSEAGAVIEFRLGGSSATVNADALGAFIVPQVTLAIGSNLLEARATDDLDNTSDWITRSVVHAPNAGASLQATLAAAADVALGAPLDVAYDVENNGNNAVAAVSAELRLVRIADQQLLHTHAFPIDLAAGAQSNGAHSFDTATTLPGAHVIALAVLLPDAQGVNTWQILASRAVDVRDVLAPAVAIIAPDADTVVDTGFVVTVSANDLHGVVASAQLQAGSGSWLPLTPEATPGIYAAVVKVSQEGALDLQARATDGAGNLATTPPRSVLVDLLPPQISIDGVSEGGLYAQAVQPTIAIVDVALTGSTITLDGIAFVSGTSVAAEGEHLLRVLAQDALGRTSEVQRRFTIDTTPPTTRIDAPADGAVIAAASTSVVGLTSEGLANVTLVVGNFTDTAAADAAGVFRFDNVQLATGANNISASATDLAGNTGPADDVDVIRQGTTLKDVQGVIELTATTWPNGDALSVPVRLTNTGVDALIDLPVTFEVRNEGLGQTLATLQATLDIASQAQAMHTFDLPTGDWGLGTRSLRLSATLPGGGTIRLLDTHLLELEDREAPLLAVLTPIEDAAVANGADVRIASSDRLSSITLVELRLDGGAWFPVAPDAGETGVYRTTLPALTLGPHALDARSVDAFGNPSIIDHVNFRVVGALPLAVDTPLDGASVTAGPVRFAGRSAAGSEVTISLGPQSWRGPVSVDGEFAIDNVLVPVGRQVFSLRAADAFGNQSAVVTITLNGLQVAAPPTPIPFHPPAWLLLCVAMLGFAANSIRRRQGVDA